MALQLAIETVYCYVCPNTRGMIGTDLSNYVNLSHRLLNQYTSHFIHSETPFNTFYSNYYRRRVFE